MNLGLEKIIKRPPSGFWDETYGKIGLATIKARLFFSLKIILVCNNNIHPQTTNLTI